MSERIALSAETLLPPWALANLPPQTPVLVGFSGGADSVTLLHLLVARSRTDGFPLLALHVHHGIRGAEADRDEVFCQRVAEALGVAFLSVRVDAPALAQESGMGLEEAARIARYQTFEQVMQARQIPLLATAHHADDQIETVLFRLARGTGLHGLCGIPVARRLTCYGVVTRPLLDYTKSDLLAYCDREGLAFVTDSTNLQPCCARNRLRMEALPALEAAVPGARAGVARTLALLRQDSEALDEMAEQELCRRARDGVLSVRGLEQLPAAIRRRVLATFVGACSPAHAERLEQQILSGCGGAVTLPGDRYAALSRGELRVFPNLRGEGLKAPRPFREEQFSLCDGRLTVSARRTEKCRKTKKVHSLSTTHYIIHSEKSAIINLFFWRGLQEGDRLITAAGARRCVSLLQERGIPAAVRQKLPVLCNGQGDIVWLPFCEGRLPRQAQEPIAGHREDTYAVTLTLLCNAAEWKDGGYENV